MTIESTVTTPEVTEIPSGDAAVNPEVAGQEIVETPAGGEEKSEPTEAERQAKALQRRVDRLTRERYQLRAENDQLRTSRQPAAADEQETLTQEDVDRRANEKAQQIADTQRMNDRCNEIAKQGAKEFKGDFDKAMAEVHGITPLFDRQGRPQPLMQAILETDEPHKVLHYLGTNPDVAEELADMSPLRAARKLGQIEIDLAKKPESKPSNAPKPLSPVKSGAAGGSPDPAKDPEGWARWRNEQMRGARK